MLKGCSISGSDIFHEVRSGLSNVTRPVFSGDAKINDLVMCTRSAEVFAVVTKIELRVLGEVQQSGEFRALFLFVCKLITFHMSGFVPFFRRVFDYLKEGELGFRQVVSNIIRDYNTKRDMTMTFENGIIKLKIESTAQYATRLKVRVSEVAQVQGSAGWWTLPICSRNVEELLQYLANSVVVTSEASVKYLKLLLEQPTMMDMIKEVVL